MGVAVMRETELYNAHNVDVSARQNKGSKQQAVGLCGADGWRGTI